MTTPSSVGQPDCALTWDSFELGVELESPSGNVAWSYDSLVRVAVVDSANAWGGWAFVMVGEGG